MDGYGGGTLAALGRHLILEMWDCSSDTVNNIEGIKKILAKTAKVINATVIDIMCHHFSPYGVTGVAILAESHISIHTWPEYKYVAADIFLCGNAISPRVAASYLIQAFHAKETSIAEFKRGDVLSRQILDYETSAPFTKDIESSAPTLL